VFGNLGRNPDVLYKCLESIPQLDVAVVSPHYLFPASPDNRIRVIRPNDQNSDRCDLLVVIEPTPFQRIEKPSTASRLVVFTSHFSFSTRQESLFTYVSFHHTGTTLDATRRHTKQLQNIQDGSIQTRNPNTIQVDAINVIFVKGRMDGIIDRPETYVIVDLSFHSTAFGMYLSFLDAFDFMLDNVDNIKGWLICFPEKHGRRAFDQFTQNCLDRLFCKTFENGNVTQLNNLLPLVPFYRSGTIDRTFQINKSSFGRVEYVAPKNTIDACKAIVMYNLQHWVGPVYRIKD
jgi:hypothetical protein